jgi:hypothetical protein
VVSVMIVAVEPGIKGWATGSGQLGDGTTTDSSLPLPVVAG